MEATNPERTRAYFIQNMVVGNTIAFTVPSKDGSGNDMLAGQVIEIGEGDEGKVIIRTKNGSIFYTTKTNIVWVRTGSRWPEGIYNALKYNKAKIKKVKE